jgi:hypothetical protein
MPRSLVGVANGLNDGRRRGFKLRLCPLGCVRSADRIKLMAQPTPLDARNDGS